MKTWVLCAVLVVATVTMAGPISIPEPLKQPRPGIAQETHDQCLTWWEDWVAQNKEALNKLDDPERHCAFVRYMQNCGEWMDDYEKPGSPQGAKAPSFHNFNMWDDSMTELWEDKCMEFDKDDPDDMSKAIRKGLTKRLEQVIYRGKGNQNDHLTRRLDPKRKITAVGLPALGQPTKREVFRRTGTQ